MRKQGTMALLALFGAAPVAAAGTINVPADYPTIQAAINAAVDGDVIKVAAGTYPENINTLGKAISLLGANNRTTKIVGDGTTSIVTINSGEGPGTVICCFEIINGGRGTLVGSRKLGGGIYISGGADPTLVDLRVGFNTADWGAGLFIDVGSNPTIDDSLIANNVTSANGLGGGVYASGNPIFTGTRFAENTASAGFGGGLYTAGGTATISDSTFDSNIAWYGGGMHAQGGSPVITGNLFEQNVVTVNPTNGEGAGLAIVAGSTALVTGNEFRFNDAHSGGGIYTYDAAPTIGDNLIHSNTASTGFKGGFGYGGGMSLGKSRGVVELNEIYLNVGAFGGGIAARSSTTTLLSGNLIDTNKTLGTGFGGGVYSKDSSPTILGATIAANDAVKGGGIYATGKSAPAIDTSIIYFNTAPTNKSFFDGTGLMTFGFSDVEAVALGGSSLSIDPQFADLANRNFSLLSTSPVIDAGNFTYGGGPTDVYGNTRVNNGRIDMGAVEF